MDSRDILVDRLVEDLVGPQSADEQLFTRPIDRYLTGILYPEQTVFGAEEDDAGGAAGDTSSDDDPGEDSQVALHQQFKPSVMGMSFRLKPTRAAGRSVSMRTVVTGGRYERLQLEEAEREKKKTRFAWRRASINEDATLRISANGDCDVTPSRLRGAAHIHIEADALAIGDEWLVTISLVNRADASSRTIGGSADELALFQSTIEVHKPDDWQFEGRPKTGMLDDSDSRTIGLIYRNSEELAVGHTCSAAWDVDETGVAAKVRTTWTPQAEVPVVSAAGHSLLVTAIRRAAPNGLQATTLAGAAGVTLLDAVVDGYQMWIGTERSRIESLPIEHRAQAALHLDECAKSADRMTAGLGYLRSTPQALDAFRLMNRAMALQRSWGDQHAKFAWRPFQIAFILQTIESLGNPESADRDVMDLLWFPTGGGKTEAYLGLIAFTIFLRRLRSDSRSRQAGVACFMRYTLRLLTLQQFERAATLICACELLRVSPPQDGLPDLRSAAPISLGLWVGGGATPNTLDDALLALDNAYAAARPQQLQVCPCCRAKLKWTATPDRSDIVVRCVDADCELSRLVANLPLRTVDELIYRDPPTLLIATVDKFAQLVRKRESQVLIRPETAPPPELLIQDELHLISGSLGSLAGAYEAAIDEVVRQENRPIKIVGSTATIRRAESQVRSLFNRRVAQFPQPGIDASDSCFAVVEKGGATRRYLGLTTAGRSAKFALQAVAATLMQGATAVPEETRDGYWSLVVYFNSLRELGGALPLVQDDVAASIKEFAFRRAEIPRTYGQPEELTSRVTQEEIRHLLDRLFRTFTEKDGVVDVLLATNMISVGVDVARLGLMIVNGQPKTTAEYIQATSRVGRSAGSPGLVVTLLNNGKARDRSSFETFCSRHAALYRSVEATSVTPFASRARDRTLHAALVLLARHMVKEMSDDPSRAAQHRVALQRFATSIVGRIAAIDPDESTAAALEMDEIISLWVHRASVVTDYWNERKRASSLLIAAEQAEPSALGRRSSVRAWPTPNSLRSVEPSMPVRLVEGLRNADS